MRPPAGKQAARPSDLWRALSAAPVPSLTLLSNLAEQLSNQKTAANLPLDARSFRALHVALGDNEKAVEAARVLHALASRLDAVPMVVRSGALGSLCAAATRSVSGTTKLQGWALAALAELVRSGVHESSVRQAMTEACLPVFIGALQPSAPSDCCAWAAEGFAALIASDPGACALGVRLGAVDLLRDCLVRPMDASPDAVDERQSDHAHDAIDRAILSALGAIAQLAVGRARILSHAEVVEAAVALVANAMTLATPAATFIGTLCAADGISAARAVLLTPSFAAALYRLLPSPGYGARPPTTAGGAGGSGTPAEGSSVLEAVRSIVHAVTSQLLASPSVSEASDSAAPAPVASAPSALRHLREVTLAVLAGAAASPQPEQRGACTLLRALLSVVEIELARSSEIEVVPLERFLQQRYGEPAARPSGNVSHQRRQGAPRPPLRQSVMAGLCVANPSTASADGAHTASGTPAMASMARTAPMPPPPPPCPSHAASVRVRTSIAQPPTVAVPSEPQPAAAAWAASASRSAARPPLVVPPPAVPPPPQPAAAPPTGAAPALRPAADGAAAPRRLRLPGAWQLEGRPRSEWAAGVRAEAEARESIERRMLQRALSECEGRAAGAAAELQAARWAARASDARCEALHASAKQLEQRAAAAEAALAASETALSIAMGRALEAEERLGTTTSAAATSEAPPSEALRSSTVASSAPQLLAQLGPTVSGGPQERNAQLEHTVRAAVADAVAVAASEAKRERLAAVEAAVREARADVEATTAAAVSDAVARALAHAARDAEASKEAAARTAAEEAGRTHAESLVAALAEAEGRRAIEVRRAFDAQQAAEARAADAQGRMELVEAARADGERRAYEQVKEARKAAEAACRSAADAHARARASECAKEDAACEFGRLVRYLMNELERAYAALTTLDASAACVDFFAESAAASPSLSLSSLRAGSRRDVPSADSPATSHGDTPWSLPSSVRASPPTADSGADGVTRAAAAATPGLRAHTPAWLRDASAALHLDDPLHDQSPQADAAAPPHSDLKAADGTARPSGTPMASGARGTAGPLAPSTSFNRSEPPSALRTGSCKVPDPGVAASHTPVPSAGGLSEPNTRPDSPDSGGGGCGSNKELRQAQKRLMQVIHSDSDILRRQLDQIRAASDELQHGTALAAATGTGHAQ